MTQYCRYCAHMFSGDANYCEVKERTFTDEQICRTNKCKDFLFNPIDVLTHEIYKPRKLRKKLEQINMMQENAEHCVCCGAIIPEGRQVCPKCLNE